MSPHDEHERSTRFRDAATFARRWIRDPRRVGAVAPSSRSLADRMTEGIGPTIRSVVELGPGTGPFTAATRRRLGDGARHVAIELDPAFARLVAQRHPEVEVVVGDAADLHRIARTTGLHQVDAVVSGLPWSIIGDDQQDRILGGVADILGGNGHFATFAYRHAMPLRGARRFLALMDRHFDQVTTGSTVWRNLPPAYVITGRAPRRGGA